MEALRPNEDRARATVTLLWIILFLQVLMLLSGYRQLDMLESINNGGLVTDEEIDLNDLREGALGIVFLITYIISGIIFIRWFRRAYYNLHLRVNHLEHSEGWAAGAWFVPIINFYYPYKIMKELYEETSEILRRKKINTHIEYNHFVVLAWWGLWVIDNILGRVSFKLSMGAETPEEFINSTTFDLYCNIISIPLTFLAIKVVKDYAAMEEKLHEVEFEG